MKKIREIYTEKFLHELGHQFIETNFKRYYTCRNCGIHMHILSSIYDGKVFSEIHLYGFPGTGGKDDLRPCQTIQDEEIIKYIIE